MSAAHALPPPRRVLYLVSLFPCWSETFIVREIEQLLAAGVDVRILSLKPPSERLVQARAQALMDRVQSPQGLAAELPAVAAECLRSPLAIAALLLACAGGLWRQPAVLGKTLVALWRGLAALPSLRRFNPDWLHAHWATYPSTVAWALARLLRRPFSFTSHAHDIFVEDQLLARKLAEAALPVTISQYNIRHLERWRASGRGQPFAVVHCGVDLSEVPLKLDERDAALIASVGRLDPIKGFDVLIPALARLAGEGREFRCRIYGEGPQRAALESARAAAGLAQRLELPGATPQEAVRALLSEAAIFVMPSVRTPEGNQDGIPVALMEAMASGCAVVSTRVSGIPELVEDGNNGLLVEAGDAAALAAALARLLDDAELRRRLGIAARASVENGFDAATEGGRLLAALQARSRELADAR
ncbi:MAG: glycosyltransferase [Aquimonas sp.]|nr:glycosyltransferase [Aquimonas sp.]